MYLRLIKIQNLFQTYRKNLPEIHPKFTPVFTSTYNEFTAKEPQRINLPTN